METVSVQTLREALSEFVARAEAGEVYLIVRHARPVALLRAPGERAGAEDVAVSAFRSELRRWLRRSRRGPLRLTWRGRGVALVEPVALPRARARR